MMLGPHIMQKGAVRLGGDLSVFHTMFIRQCGAYVLFACYAVWQHPGLSRAVWVLQVVIVIIKSTSVARPPIKLEVHLAECVGMTVIGVVASAWYLTHDTAT